MDIPGAGEAIEALPIKRKSPRQGGAAGTAPPLQPPSARHQRGPTCSSPALGGWAAGPERLSAQGAEADLDDCHDSVESARGKAQRVCCIDAAAAAAAAAAPRDSSSTSVAAIDKSGAMDCPGASKQLAMVSSLPPALFRSCHVSCCSRLSSSGSLLELEASAGAAAADGGPSAAIEAAAHQAGTPPTRPPACAAACRCGACGLRAASSGPSQVQQQHGHLVPAPGQQRPPGQEAAAPVASAWADMPDDILKRVLERLPPSTLRVLRLVCRGWESGASRLLRHLRPEAVAGKQLGRRFPALHSLDLSNAAMGVDFATPRMLRLQSLLRDRDLAELAELHRLEQLSLRGCSRLSGEGLRLLAPLGASLTVLNLSNCAGVGDGCLAALAAALPRLATLSLQGCGRVGDRGIAQLAALPGLRHLLLPGGVTDAAMHTLAASPALERVALRGCTRVTTAGVYVLLQRRGLQRVVISKCPHVTLESLCGEPNLKVITEGAAAAPVPGSSAAAMGTGRGGTLAAAAVGLAGQDMHLLVADV